MRQSPVHLQHCEVQKKKASEQSVKTGDIPRKRSSTDDVDTRSYRFEETVKALKEACVVGAGVSVKMSPLGGKGLFVDRAFARDEYITKLEGMHEQVTPERLQAIKADTVLWHHLITLRANEVIHGIYEVQDGWGGGSFANDGGISDLFKANADYIYLEELNEIYLRASRPLKPGEEVLAKYGPYHWKLARQHCPEMHEQIFKQQVRTKAQIEAAFESFPRAGMSGVLPHFQQTPVPTMPELKGRQRKTWTNQALRYAMYSRGIDDRYLNVPTLKALDKASIEYYRAVRHYLMRLKSDTGFTANDWNDAGLPVPDCGVFRNTKKWNAGHLNFMLWQAGSERFKRSPDPITYSLNTLSTDCPDFCAMVVEYAKVILKVQDGAEIDLNQAVFYERMERMLSNLRLSEVPLPKKVGERSFLYDSWTHAAMKQLLKASWIHHFGSSNYGRARPAGKACQSG